LNSNYALRTDRSTFRPPLRLGKPPPVPKSAGEGEVGAMAPRVGASAMGYE